MNVELSIIYDYYGNLLTEKQKIYFEDYYFSNLSLNEIAINYNVSRNAVYNSLKEIEKKLLHYEEVLKLYKKGKIIKNLIKDLDENLKKEIEKLV